MQRRTHESPMDFEWQSAPPLDHTSPFTHLAQKQGQNSSFSFATPSKASNTLNTQSSSFRSAAAPAPPFRNPSFTTPRRAFDPDLFSETSGAESSPADNADAEDTPENPRTSTTMTAHTSHNYDRKPIFGKFGLDYKGSSPGRGELRRGKYADAVIHKVRKRKRLDRDNAVQLGRRGSSDADSDSGERHNGRKDRSRVNPPQKENMWLSFFNFIESKPALPYILSYYAQLLLNWFLVLAVIYIAWIFFTTIRADVDKASEAAAASVLSEMAQCAKDYADNKCTPGHRLPALESVCQGWEACMNRDPSQVGRARVSAHTFAEIFNSFVEPISWKAMVFVVVFLLTCIGANNFAFSLFRSKSTHPPPPPQYYAPTPSHQDFQWGAIPQTPRHASGQDVYMGNMGTPFPAIMPSQTPGRRGSPRKGSWQ